MIPVKQLVMSLRYALKDMQSVNNSDFELIEVINQAVSLLYTRMSEQYVNYGMKKRVLVIYDSEFLLRTPTASMDNSGVILLNQGGVIRWVKPLK